MQQCQFSETQFSFCFTFEFVRQFIPFVPLPIFPNTVDEGRIGGGYDVKISGNIFYQFKIPTYHDLVNNFFRLHWNVFNHDYYKIKLNTDGEQFRLLKTLYWQSSINEVYYATPEFWDATTLSSYYSSDSILTNSALFPIGSLPEHGSGHHHLIYSPRHNWGRLFSEPINIRKVKLVNPFELFSDTVKEETIYSQAVRISALLREGQYLNSDFPELNTNNPAQLVKNVYSILLTQYDIHWYPVASWQQGR